MLTMLKNWEGKVQVNGTPYNSMADFLVGKTQFSDNIHIILYSNAKNTEKPSKTGENEVGNKEYRIKVKKWMTEPTEYDANGHSSFDFMAKWNNNVPMPLMMMTGTIDKETPGMYHMKLHGDMYSEKMHTCMKCGRKLNNPVSQYFGIGPECGNHGYVNPFNSDEELRAAVDAYKKELVNIKWEGWVVKSAIKEMEAVE